MTRSPHHDRDRTAPRPKAAALASRCIIAACHVTAIFLPGEGGPGGVRAVPLR